MYLCMCVCGRGFCGCSFTLNPSSIPRFLTKIPHRSSSSQDSLSPEWMIHDHHNYNYNYNHNHDHPFLVCSFFIRPASWGGSTAKYCPPHRDNNYVLVGIAATDGDDASVRSDRYGSGSESPRGSDGQFAASPSSPSTTTTNRDADSWCSLSGNCWICVSWNVDVVVAVVVGFDFVPRCRYRILRSQSSNRESHPPLPCGK